MPRGSYGVDAPAALAGLVLWAVASTVLAVVLLALGLWPGWIALAGAVYAVPSAASFAYTTLRGKFAVWRRELSGVRATAALDLGCGRGAVLVLVARVAGRATGVDLWTRDQSGNDESRTRGNLEVEGVADRVELLTADLRALPLEDESYDLVVSSLAIHNIAEAAGREQAVAEAYRVLAPGGRLMIADFQHAVAYARTVRELGGENVAVRPLGWRFWYGAPWFGTSMLTARKPV